MMLILKIPIIYLALVVWYAIRAEPEPGVDPTEYSVWRPWRRPAGPARGRGGAGRTARATRSASRARGAIESRRDLDEQATTPARPRQSPACWPQARCSSAGSSCSTGRSASRRRR